MEKSEEMLERAGEIMDEEMGDTRVKHETISVAAHLRFVDPVL